MFGCLLWEWDQFLHLKKRLDFPLEMGPFALGMGLHAGHT